MKRVLILLIITATASAQDAAGAVEQSDLLRLYAHSRIINYEQFKCFDALITKESNWRVNAKNGSHYGLGQMRNPRYRELDGYRQIDWTLRYIKARYSGSSCNAYRHWQKRGWH